MCQRGSEDEALFFSRLAPASVSDVGADAELVGEPVSGEKDGQGTMDVEVEQEEKVWAYREDVGLGGDGADMLMEEVSLSVSRGNWVWNAGGVRRVEDAWVGVSG